MNADSTVSKYFVDKADLQDEFMGNHDSMSLAVGCDADGASYTAPADQPPLACGGAGSSPAYIAPSWAPAPAAAAPASRFLLARVWDPCCR